LSGNAIDVFASLLCGRSFGENPAIAPLVPAAIVRDAIVRHASDLAVTVALTVIVQQNRG
jgi:hypothetical protein